MLAYTSRDDGVFPVLDLSGKLLDDFLRLQGLPSLALLIGEGILLLPLLEVVEPSLPWRVLNQGDEGSHALNDVADDWNRGVYNLVDVLGLDLEVNDTAATLEGSCSGGRSECYALQNKLAQNFR